MSWGLSVSNVKPDEVGAELRAAADRQLELAAFDAWDDDVAEQMKVAIAAAEELGAVAGEPLLNVSVGGHARRGENDSALLNAYVSGATPQPSSA